MAALERFLARSITDMQLNRIVEAFYGEPHAPHRTDTETIIRAVAQAARHHDGDVELTIDFK